MEGNAEFPNQPEEQPKEKDVRQRVEDKFKQAFAKVLQEKPRISVDIFFSAHGTTKDIEGLKERVEEYDIYIPEAFGWTKKLLDLFREASSGEISFKELTKKLKRYYPTVPKTVVEDVYDSGKAIAIIDVRARHRLRKESDEVWEYKPSYEGDFEQALAYTRTFLANLANYNNQREDYMLSQITPKKVEELLKTYPWLRNKQKIRVLLSLGVAHASMPLDYSEYSFTDEGIIRSKFGKEVDDELAARIYAESFLEILLAGGYLISLRRWLTKDSQKISKLTRGIFCQFSYEDAQRIFNYCKRKGLFPRSEFDRMFEEKGLTIPRSEKELDDFLAKPITPVSGQ